MEDDKESLVSFALYIHCGILVEPLTQADRIIQVSEGAPYRMSEGRTSQL